MTPEEPTEALEPVQHPVYTLVRRSTLPAEAIRVQGALQHAVVRAVETAEILLQLTDRETTGAILGFDDPESMARYVTDLIHQEWAGYVP